MEIEILKKNFKRNEKILNQMFKIEFQDKIEILTFELHPDIVEEILHGYEIVLEFDVLKEVDPDLDYISTEIKKILSQISNFLGEYIIGPDGKFITDKRKITFESYLPVVSHLDYVYGEKLIVGTFFRINY